MSVKCTKLFELREDAANFALAHSDYYAKLRRSTEDERKQLKTESQWAVVWYENHYQGARPVRNRFDNEITDKQTLASAAAR